MIDLAIDANDNLTLGTGQEITTVIEGSEVAQAVKIAVRSWFEEYFIDQNFGVKYLDKIFTKPFNKAQAQREMRRIINQIEGVRSIKTLTITPNLDLRQLNLTAEIYTIYGSELISA